MKKYVILAVLIAGVWQMLSSRSISLGPGVKAAAAPVQVTIDLPNSFSLKGYTITPLATFDIKAKVLSRKNYSIGRESELSPIDLALGWGNMSDEDVLEHIVISQSRRWYRWRAEEYPIPRREIETHSANMHLIPANDVVEGSMGRARKGEIIKLKGKLVQIEAGDGWQWASSLTREDAGARACELIWVTDFSVEP